MKRVLQPNLRRGHVADRVGLLLLISLLVVLLASLFSGVRSLPLS